MQVKDALEVLLNLSVVVSNDFNQLLNSLLRLSTFQVNAQLPVPALDPHIERVFAIALQEGARLLVSLLCAEQL